tara:strand:+ start:1522 stop:1692 length:171 start_codon:yes stop_codon:yes gene_type:complete
MKDTIGNTFQDKTTGKTFICVEKGKRIVYIQIEHLEQDSWKEYHSIAQTFREANSE